MDLKALKQRKKELKLSLASGLKGKEYLDTLKEYTELIQEERRFKNGGENES